MIFRVIGGIVVYGFALYGAAEFLDRPKRAVVIKPDRAKEPAGKPDSATDARHTGVD